MNADGPCDNRTTGAIDMQDQIGWGNFMLGRVAKEWESVWGNSRRRGRKQMTSTKLIRCIYNIAYAMWENRNKILHEKEDTHNLLGEEELNNKIRTQKALGKYNLLPNDFHLINTSL